MPAFNYTKVSLDLNWEKSYRENYKRKPKDCNFLFIITMSQSSCQRTIFKKYTKKKAFHDTAIYKL